MKLVAGVLRLNNVDGCTYEGRVTLPARHEKLKVFAPFKAGEKPLGLVLTMSSTQNHTKRRRVRYQRLITALAHLFDVERLLVLTVTRGKQSYTGWIHTRKDMI